MNKPYLIATACNQKYEDFLINHWLKSLKENVDLSNIDILVIDFGLSDNAKKKLKSENVILHQVENKEGHINNLRFVELRNYLLKQGNYEQVVLCDSGDIIFQSDISQIFKIHPEKIKGVCEEISPNMDIVLNDKNVRGANEIKTFLKGRKLINAGFIVYPTKKFNNIVQKMFDRIIDKSAWGVDMVLLNYFIYQEDFFELPVIYNFIPTTSTQRYFVKDGKFYLKDGTLIPVVHNAGGKNIWRSIRNFGYGKEFNKPRLIVVYLLRVFYSIISRIREPLKR